MTETEQAKELQRRIKASLKALKRTDKKGFNEPEILFRLEALEGMLIMALNDVNAMVKDWEALDEMEQATKKKIISNN